MLTSFCCGPELVTPPPAQLSLGALVVSPQDHLMGISGHRQGEAS